MLKTYFLQYKYLLYICCLWFFITAFNLNKAYHIDDTFHLETAQWIAEHPLHPMSGLVNWDNNARPIHLENQPHLYFYLLALWGKIFGFNEIPMHLFQSIFAFLFILLTYKICKYFIPKYSILATALLSLNPAIVVGTNLMVDVPLLSIFLFLIFILISKNYLLQKIQIPVANFAIGIACLIKYTSLALLPAFFLYSLVRRKYRHLLYLAIPIIMLGLWSLFNIFDYGQIHIVGRNHSSSFSLNKFFSFIICLGAIVPYSPIFFLQKNKIKILLTLIISGFLSIIVIHQTHAMSSLSIINKSLLIIHCYNGLFLFTLLGFSFFENINNLYKSNSIDLFLYFLILFIILFILLYAPFIATRHVVLIIVPLSLLLFKDVEFKNSLCAKLIIVSSVFFTFILSFFLEISDWRWANYYRTAAQNIKQMVPKDVKIYFSGHWGWQWYARKNGMIQLEALTPELSGSCKLKVGP